MSSPIQTRIGQVFIPVRDLQRSIRWYAAVLGVEPGEPSHGDTICDLPTEHEVGLALDANRPDFDPSGPPRFFFWTDDLAAVARHLRSLDVTITSDVEDIGSVAFIQFEDPDGNALMVCQRT